MQQRFFAPGETPRIVVSGFCGRAGKSVQVMLRFLVGGGIEVLDVIELTAAAPKPMPFFLQRTAGDPKPANAPRGPMRKGAGGKVRRW